LNRLETRPQPTFAPPTPAAAPVAPEPAPIQKAIPEDIRQIINKWDEFCRGLDASDSGLLGHTKPGFLDDGRLIIVVNQPAHEGILKKRVEGIEAALQKHFGKAVDIHIMLKIHYDDRHRKKYGGLDDFKPGTVASPAVSEKIVDEFDEIKKVLNFNIIEE
ncbi:MAG: hypothetical protein FWB71_06885, partial [Defluviitaleaceae bacterium]|nr:hypothetical protein [Defluviitaleaceae bacterium]